MLGCGPLGVGQLGLACARARFAVGCAVRGLRFTAGGQSSYSCWYPTAIHTFSFSHWVGEEATMCGDGWTMFGVHSGRVCVFPFVPCSTSWTCLASFTRDVLFYKCSICCISTFSRFSRFHDFSRSDMGCIFHALTCLDTLQQFDMINGVRVLVAPFHAV